MPSPYRTLRAVALFAFLLASPLWAQAADLDGDGVDDSIDNCPQFPNPDQSDLGGLGSLSSDGRGDVCQCGEHSQDGAVMIDDIVRIRRALQGLAPGLADPQRCNTSGPQDAADGDGNGIRDDCDQADVDALRAALAGQPGPFLDICEPAATPADCSLEILPQAVAEGVTAPAFWASSAGQSCTLGCDITGDPAAAPCMGSGELTPEASTACTLQVEPSPGVAPTSCSDSILVGDGACPVPSCDVALSGAPGTDATLTADSDGMFCRYECDGLAPGEIACQDSLDLGAPATSCRLIATSSCGSQSSCASTPWTAAITADADLGDWPGGTAFPTSGGTTWIGWDSDFLWVALQHPAVGSDDGRYSVMLYLGDGQAPSGSTIAPLVGSQQPMLPVPMSHAVRWSADGAVLQLLTANVDGSWTTSDGWLGSGNGSLVSVDPASDVVELQIPLGLLGLGDRVRVIVAVLDTQTGSERTFAATPANASPDQYMGPESEFENFLEFNRKDWLLPSAYLPFPAPYTPLVPSVVPPGTGWSARLLTYNTALIDIPDIPIFQCVPTPAGPVCAILSPSLFVEVDNETYFNEMPDEDRAYRIAKGILRTDVDVVVLDEVFDEKARTQFINSLSPTFPYYVSQIRGALHAEVDFDTLAAPVVWNVQDSGLMLFSRWPFVPLSLTGRLAPASDVDITAGGTSLDNSVAQVLAWTDFEDECSMPDCLAYKGAGLVRVQMPNGDVFTVVFTHTQASYGTPTSSPQELLDRQAQLDDIEGLMKDTLLPAETAADKVYAMGDLNIIGRFFPPGDELHENDSHQAPLSPTEATAWDFSRQEWLYHFCGDRPLLFFNPMPGDLCFNSAAAASIVPAPTAPDFFSCGDGDVSSCPEPSLVPDLENFMVDSWAFDTSPQDQGRTNGEKFFFDIARPCTGLNPDDGADDLLSTVCTGERLDYVLHNVPGTTGDLGDRNSLCVQHPTIAWSLGEQGGLDQFSDHLGVRADVNRWAPLCRPREAHDVVRADFANPNSTVVLPGTITFPGSMQWYRIVDAGAYAIRTTSNEAGFAVYAADDLSRPLAPYHDEVTDFGTRYVLKDPPYYVRVFAQQPPPEPAGKPDRTWTGPYELRIHLHTCANDQDSCPITAGGSGLPMIWPGDQPLNGEDAAWFDFYTDVGDKGDFPLLSFEILGSWIANYSFQVVASDAPVFTPIYDATDSNPANDFPVGPVVQPGNVLHAEASNLPGGSSIQGQKYYLKVWRDEILQDDGTPCLTTFPPCVPLAEPDRTIEVSWGTNLTYFQPEHLIIDDLEDAGPFNDHDEVYYLVDTETTPVTVLTPAFGYFGGGLAEGPHGYPASAFGQHKYVGNLHVNLIEWDGPPQNDGRYLVPAPPPVNLNNPDCVLAGICPMSRELQTLHTYQEFHEGDPSDYDYLYRITFCLRHEYVPQAGSSCNH